MIFAFTDEADLPVMTKWWGCIAHEGVTTCDNRLIAPFAVDLTEGPVLHLPIFDVPFGRRIGTIDEVHRNPAGGGTHDLIARGLINLPAGRYPVGILLTIVDFQCDLTRDLDIGLATILGGNLIGMWIEPDGMAVWPDTEITVDQ